MANTTETSGKTNFAISPFPDLFASKEIKANPEFGLQEAKAIWTTHMNNIGSYNEQRQHDIICRQYAEGLQSIEKYKKMKGLTGPSYSNLDFTPVNIIATTIDKVVGQLTSTPYKIQCNAIDPESRLRFDSFRDEMHTDMVLKQYSDAVEERTGVPLVSKNKYVPENDDEGDLHLQMNYKEAASEAMEQAFEYVLSNNDFDESRELIIRDLLTIKRSAIYRYYDEDWNLKVERIDPLDLITPYSKDYRFRNIPYVGLIKDYTIQQISTMRDFTDEELWTIAMNNAGRNNNPQWNYGTSYEGYYANANGILPKPYYNFNIQVLEFSFLTIDKQVRELKTVKRRSYFNKIKESDLIDKTKDGKPIDSNSEIISKDIQNVYEGLWIINSDVMISYGLTKNIPREKIKGSYSTKASLPIKIIAPGIYDMKNKSHVARMIPSEDDINLGNLSLQMLSAKAKPPGVAVDIQGLLEAAAGMGEGIEPIDIIKLYEQTGNLITSSATTDGDPISTKTITELRGGISQAMVELIQVHRHYRALILDVIGINPNADPTSPGSKDVGLGIQDNAIQATNHSLRPIFNAHLSLIHSAAKDLSLMIQDCIENDNEAFMNGIGNYATKVIEYGKSLSMAQIGIKIELLPDDTEKKDLMELMALGVKNQTLESSDVIRIKAVMKENVKLANQLLVLLEAKNRKNKLQESAFLQQQNAQVQSQAAQAAEAAKAQSAMMAEKAKQSTLILQSKLEEEAKLREFNRAMKLQELKNQGIENVAYIQNTGKVKIQETANTGKMSVEAIKHESAIKHTAFEHAITPEEEKAGGE